MGPSSPQQPFDINFLALKVVTSLMEGGRLKEVWNINNSNLAWKILVFWKTGQ